MVGGRSEFFQKIHPIWRSHPYQSNFFIRSHHKFLHKSCLMHCGGIFKPCCSYSETTRPNMQNTHILKIMLHQIKKLWVFGKPSIFYKYERKLGDNEANFCFPFFAILSFQTNFQETSNAKSLAVIYCLAFISVWLFNDLNTKYISRGAQRCQRENEYRNG